MHFVSSVTLFSGWGSIDVKFCHYILWYYSENNKSDGKNNLLPFYSNCMAQQSGLHKHKCCSNISVCNAVN